MTHELDIEKRWLILARTDPEAFFFFYQKYYDRLFRLCQNRVLDVDLAEDLVAETFLKAQRSLPRFRWMGLTMGAWLFRIALNQVRSHLRNRLPTAPLDPEDNALAGGGTDPLGEVLLDETQRRVRRAMGGLDAATAEIVRLHYWDELGIREIGVVLDLPAGTVKSRLSRGRRRLRELLARLDEEGAAEPR